MRDDVRKMVGFLAALLGGGALAFGLYAGLQPSVEAVVHTAERRHMRQDSLVLDSMARYRAALKGGPAKHKKTAPTLPKAATRPATVAAAAASQAGAATAAAPAAGPPAASLPGSASKPLAGASVGRLTRLQPPAATHDHSFRGWLGLALGLALAGSAGALWQARRGLAPLEITSPVLEALLTVPTHMRMLQNLSLLPRQIKRFNSKARVQHRQLAALARLATDFQFPVDSQLVAFQLLLLLEEDREGPQHLLYAGQSEFIERLNHSYPTRADLKAARLEALSTAAVQEARQREPSPPTPAPFPIMYHQLLVQLHEMNVGLLA